MWGTCLFEPYLQVPAGEVQVPGSGVHGDGARVLDAGFERAPVGAVQLGHLQVLAVPVQPVQLVAHPVDSHAFQSMAVVPDDALAVRAGTADARPVDGLGAHVAEVQPAVSVVKVQRHHIEQVLVAERVLGRVQRHVAHVVLVGEHQPRPGPVPAFARPLVRRPVVVRLVALAVVRPGRVQAVLRARARHFGALVHVLACLAVRHQPVGYAQR